jgi:hypothetical protein
MFILFALKAQKKVHITKYRNKYNLKGETHEVNSNSISLCAKVPPYLPVRPFEFVFSVHCFTDRMNLFKPASFVYRNAIPHSTKGGIKKKIPPTSAILCSFNSRYPARRE